MKITIKGAGLMIFGVVSVVGTVLIIAYTFGGSSEYPAENKENRKTDGGVASPVLPRQPPAGAPLNPLVSRPSNSNKKAHQKENGGNGTQAPASAVLQEAWASLGKLLTVPAAKKAYQESDLLKHLEEPKVVLNCYITMYSSESAAITDVEEVNSKNRIEAFDTFRAAYRAHFRNLLPNCNESKKPLYKRLSSNDFGDAGSLKHLKSEVGKKLESLITKLPAELKSVYEEAKETYLTDFDVSRKLVVSTLNSPTMNPDFYIAFKNFFTSLETFWKVQAPIWNFTCESAVEIYHGDLYGSISSNFISAITKASALKKVDDKLYQQSVVNPGVDTLVKLFVKALKNDEYVRVIQEIEKATLPWCRLLIIQNSRDKQVSDSAVQQLKFALGPTGAAKFITSVKKFEKEAEPLAQKKTPESYAVAIKSVQVDSDEIKADIIDRILDTVTWKSLFSNAGNKYDQVKILFETAKEVYTIMKPALEAYGKHLLTDIFSKGEKLLTWQPPAKKAADSDSDDGIAKISEKLDAESSSIHSALKKSKDAINENLSTFVVNIEPLFRQSVQGNNLIHFLFTVPYFDKLSNQTVKNFYKSLLDLNIMRAAYELIKDASDLQSVLDQNYQVPAFNIGEAELQALLIKAMALFVRNPFRGSGQKFAPESYPESFIAPGLQKTYDDNFGKISSNEERSQKVDEYMAAKLEELKPIIKQANDYYQAFLKNEGQKLIKKLAA